MLKINIEQVISIIKSSKSIAEVNEKIGYNRESTAGYRRIKNIIKDNNIDISHFTGQRWSKGKTILTDDRLKNKYNKDEIFIENSKVSRGYIKELIIKNNLISYECSECKIIKWRNKKLSLELEHKNGIRNDHRLENLTFLCPNCHSLTNTFRGRNIKPKLVIPEDRILEIAKESKNIREILIKLSLASEGGNYKRIKRILKENNFVFPRNITIEESRISNINPHWRNRPKLNIRKVERPSKEELIELIKLKPIIEIAKQFNLKSDNSIRKWCINYEINYKELSPFSLKKVS